MANRGRKRGLDSPRKRKSSIVQSIREHLVGLDVLFVLTLALLSVLDFFALLPGDVAVLKKIVSFVMLSVLFYRAQPTKILFGKEALKSGLDVALLFLYSLLSFRVIVERVAVLSFHEAVFFRGILLFLYEHALEVSMGSLYLGFAGLILLAIFVGFSGPIRGACLFERIRGFLKVRSKRKPFIGRTGQIALVYLVLLTFYITIYSFLFEWLSIALDASILVVTLVAGAIIFLRRRYHLFLTHKIREALKMDVARETHHLVEPVESLELGFLRLLAKKRHWALPFMGILVLHLVVAAGVFVIPYAAGAMDSTYFSSLGEGHTPLLSLAAPLLSVFQKETPQSLLSLQTQGLSPMLSVGLTTVYLMNVLAILFLLLNPFILWLHLYRNRSKPAHRMLPIRSSLYRLFQFLFVISLGALLLTPVFSIVPVSKSVSDVAPLRGVDIQTRQVENLGMVVVVLAISALIGFLYWALQKKHGEAVSRILNTGNVLFFLVYIFLFARDVLGSFVGAVRGMIPAHPLLSLHFGLFLVTLGVFYPLGTGAFIRRLSVRRQIRLPILLEQMFLLNK